MLHLLLQAYFKAAGSDAAQACDHGVGFVDAGDRGEYHRCHAEGLAERDRGKGLRRKLVRRQTTGFDPDACAEDVRTTFHG